MIHGTREVRILAEVPACRDPAGDTIHACVRAASAAGADAVRVASPGGFAEEALQEWIELRRCVLRLDLDVVATVASVGDVAFARRVGVGGLAVSTTPGTEGDAVWEAVGRAHLPVVLLSDPPADANLGTALEVLQRYDNQITVLFGGAERPVPAEKLGLGRLSASLPGERVARGFADRSGTGWGALAACALGADVFELPVSLSPYLAGSEGGLSPESLQHTVKGLRYLAWARGCERAR